MCLHSNFYLFESQDSKAAVYLQGGEGARGIYMFKWETLEPSHSFRWVSVVLLSGLVYASKETLHLLKWLDPGSVCSALWKRPMWLKKLK